MPENTTVNLPASIAKKTLLDSLAKYNVYLKYWNDILVSGKCPSDGYEGEQSKERVCCRACGRIWICIGRVDPNQLPIIVKGGELINT